MRIFVKSKWVAVLLTGWFLLTAFDFSRHSIPPEEIQSGGPPKDGIPALTDPAFLSAAQAHYLKPADRVIGFTHGGEARAYPVRILNWHEVVNDAVGDLPVAVVYCPLCGSGTIFNAGAGGKRKTFGVSGLLYNSDVLIYDRETESLWSQIKMESVTGPLTGTQLELLNSLNTTWEDWKRRYPDTRVLSLETGYGRDYARDPYGNYAQVKEVYFPLSNRDNRLHPKAWVLGVEISGEFKAYAFSALRGLAAPLADRVGGRDVTVHFDETSGSAWIEDEEGRPVPALRAYWFAWFTFHPDTGLFWENRDV